MDKENQALCKRMKLNQASKRLVKGSKLFG